MQRVSEPEELMDDPAQAAAYAGADFSEANELFIHLLRQRVTQGLRGRALDLGCAPGRYAHRLRGLEVSMVSDRHWAARGHLTGAD